MFLAGTAFIITAIIQIQIDVSLQSVHSNPSSIRKWRVLINHCFYKCCCNHQINGGIFINNNIHKFYCMDQILFLFQNAAPKSVDGNSARFLFINAAPCDVSITTDNNIQPPCMNCNNLIVMCCETQAICITIGYNTITKT